MAETVITTAVTTPQLTGTANDHIRISSTGSVKPTSGTAVTINTNHTAKNEGAIAISGANNAVGILANTNLSSGITNTGSITIDESFTPTDGDNDGDLDGGFAQGSGRYGIRVLGGGTFTGSIVNAGAITIEGNQSAAIAIDSALVGSIFSSAGTVSALGDNSFGLRAGNVTGDVRLTGGSIGAKGANSVAVALTGNVGGAVVVQNNLTSTGYRYTTPPADVSKLDSDDLLQGGSALVVQGNVAGGILFDTRPKDNSTTDDDEDDDGVKDADEQTASILTFGSAPAVAIGSNSQDIVIGSVAGSAEGLVNRGQVGAAGVYKGVNATGLWIGGSGGHTVAINGGLSNSGGISAGAVEGNATAVRIGAGASVPTITNSGSIQAQGGGTDSTTATAILIESGATVTTLRNSGTIAAQLASGKGVGAAITDNSGTLSLIENKGTIGVSSADTLGDRAIAIDLRSRASGATVHQQAVTSGSGPSISGNVLFGAGDDVLRVEDGAVVGAVRFGTGANQLLLSGDAVVAGAVTFAGGADNIQLAGTARMLGDVNFGGGLDTLSLSGTSLFRGKLSNSEGLAVNVGAGSTLDATNAGAVNLSSLTTGAGSTLGVTLGAGNAATVYTVSGLASFGTGTKVQVNLTTLDQIAGSYTIVDAGTLVGAGNLLPEVTDLPFLYKANLATPTAGKVNLSVAVKSAEELGINDSEASILGAVIAAADADAAVASSFLAIEDSETLQDSLQQMLPEHAGGAFEIVTKGSRLTTKVLADPNSAIVENGGMGLWAQQVAWGINKPVGTTSSYKVSGWGAAGGVETAVGPLGNVGLSLAYLSGKNNPRNNELVSSQFEGGVYWRGGVGPLRAYARATGGRVSFDGTRRFSSTAGTQNVTREAEGEWKGTVYSASAGVTYQARMGRLTLRPLASIEHFKLNEKGYSESGGGAAFDLIVGKRSSSETAANGVVNLGFDLMSIAAGEPWMRVELEGGWRQILSSSLGETRAHYDGGEVFSLTAEDRTSGWLGALRLAGGGSFMSVVAELNAEKQQGRASAGGRLGIQLPF